MTKVRLFKKGTNDSDPPRLQTKTALQDFPGGPAIKTPSSHCKGAQVQSLVGELRSTQAAWRGQNDKNEEQQQQKHNREDIPKPKVEEIVSRVDSGPSEPRNVFTWGW